MQPTSHTCILLGSAAVAAFLSSCNITQQTIDFSVFSEAVVPAQNDDVQVEAGSGLPESAVASAPAAATPAAPVATTPAATTAGGSYTVLKGDTLSGIARKHRVSLAALYAANGLSETNTAIRDGQTLIIPAAGSTPVAATPATANKHQVAAAPARTAKGSYTVASGDTISSIARRHKISSAALMQANGLTKETADKLSIGQTLNIPAN